MKRSHAELVDEWNTYMSEVTELLAKMAPLAFVIGREDMMRATVNVFRVLDAINDAINTGQPIVSKLANKLLGLVPPTGDPQP